MSRSLPAFITPQAVRLEDLSKLCGQQARASDYPLCAEVQENVPIYAAQTLRDSSRATVLNELHRLFRDGPGVMVVRQGYTDLSVVDRHSEVFEAIFREEAAATPCADHFAEAGTNGRIWNSLQKAALLAPASFAEYYANPLLGLIAEAWLGPGFQVTAQVNVVHPGGQAQQPHRDYHLGFQTADVVERFPLPLHVLSQYLTLQGAVAHTDMPVESGPTMLLPYSQQYDLGYLAYRLPEFIEYFEQHSVQLALNKGDLLFFNPALLHAAGTNHTTEQHRMANLLQISSAFGKPMENLDRDRMMLALYPVLQQLQTAHLLDAQQINAVIACTADGYSFPTNLDTDPPLKGLAPQTGQQLMVQALAERWEPVIFAQAVERMRKKRRA
ncbi:phytanoyl-CoA dioxygenase [Pseudomonas amygdali pv. morsprunorum]|uniref:Protein involved in biosynthesis of mitomycin antibiotics/polyketide fumonisin n=1 Tax=Pseudomonas syringae pv. daphniphylli TaxID=264455 RepID=A0A9X0H411_PSESX|nr:MULTISPECIES: phytanoyl-CoA dioxygenase family protein [Pseudomonas syringae group]KPX12349.1 Protein involved in biosynthesis of mitomycin antibiotics/polyketide fumonisin [Pseudomonas syringae pv. daphniphylli]KWS82166.1 phytanoyl-CoA dioxygenase [Pseudomonas syringae pv. daphniphylli]POC98146.1 phytanoyl-CoA dioxygenase [Pseudomonas amygdali pv. morsprunorum]POD37043.1 phytanoyl-CoA dioxygenase [Pseudomonas amygdali pv. morsprunorum]POD38561.1 phytanoyl-CoA dioxygenase [Pseudomonas amygd